MRKNIRLIIAVSVMSTAMLIGGCGTAKIKPLDNVEMSMDGLFRKDFPKETKKIEEEMQEKYGIETDASQTISVRTNSIS